jgi:hypothetical protein
MKNNNVKNKIFKNEKKKDKRTILSRFWKVQSKI